MALGGRNQISLTWKHFTSENFTSLIQEKYAESMLLRSKIDFSYCAENPCVSALREGGQSMLVLASQGRKTEVLPLLGSAELYAREKQGRRVLHPSQQ